MRILIALKVPQWLLWVTLSYLQNSKMILRFRNCCSDPKCLPGGCPQGTLIGVILYILYINPTLQESIDLTSALATKLDWTGPLPWWESSGKLLLNENTILQPAIETMKTISDDREMILNPDKTKLMIVNFSSINFQSLLYIPGSPQKIDLCSETKLLEVLPHSWHETKYSCISHPKDSLQYTLGHL